MQVASAEGENWGSASAMDNSGAKKLRLELPNGHVKQQFGVQVGAGGEGAGEVVAAEYGSGVDLPVRIDMRVLHCPLCARPLKPPVLQCNGGHLACGVCVDALLGGVRETCDDADGVFGPCPALDAVVSSAKVACPHHGCGRFIVHHESGEHQSAYAHAPCRCAEPGCVSSFAGSPRALADHLESVHSVPVHTVKYGELSQLEVSASVPRLLLVSEEDAHVFLLTMGALGVAGASAVSVVCVRASTAARPIFTCKMRVNLAQPANGNGNGNSDVVLVEMQMRSSTTPSAVVAADEPTFLVVPPMYLVPGTSGDGGPSKEVHLSVRIDKEAGNAVRRGS